MFRGKKVFPRNSGEMFRGKKVFPRNSEAMFRGKNIFLCKPWKKPGINGGRSVKNAPVMKTEQSFILKAKRDDEIKGKTAS